MGNQKTVDLMINDGLWCSVGDEHMGYTAERLVEKYGLTREEQDAFSILSYQRAITAQKEGRFKDEIVPVSIPQRKRDALIIDSDEEPSKVNFDKISGPLSVIAIECSKCADGLPSFVLTVQSSSAKNTS